MNITSEDKKRQEFKDLLLQLAKSQTLLNDRCEKHRVYKQLEDLYHSTNNDKFRHFYSDIFSVLTQIEQDIKSGNAEILSQNLHEIRKGYKPNVNKDEKGNDIDVSDSIRKLYDHVNLDVARINYIDKENREAQGQETEELVNNSMNKVCGLEKQLSITKANMDDLDKKLSDSQKEYIAILGIFSAVVLAFIAEIAFTTSVLQNLNQSSVYRVVIAILLIGVVTSNVIYGLFYFIDKIVRRKNEANLKPIIIVNIILIVLLVCVLCAWFFGLVEYRNKRF